jgi:hypothetical protein
MNCRLQVDIGWGRRQGDVDMWVGTLLGALAYPDVEDSAPSRQILPRRQARPSTHTHTIYATGVLATRAGQLCMLPLHSASRICRECRPEHSDTIVRTSKRVTMV